MATIQSDVVSRVFSVIKKCSSIPDNQLDIVNWDKPLTGEFYRLTDIDLVYIFFEIEQEFDIQICSEELECYHFGTIHGICEIVQKLL